MPLPLSNITCTLLLATNLLYAESLEPTRSPPTSPHSTELMPPTVNRIDTAPEPAAPVGTPDNGVQHSVAPIAGYNPTYKFFFGGGYFISSPLVSAGTHLVITFDKVFQIMTHLTHRVSPFWNYRFELEFSKGFDPYYGEGGETLASSLENIYGHKILSKLKLNHQINKSLEIGPYIDFRLRRETDVNGDTSRRLFPNEDIAGLGMAQSLDYRDNPDNPSTGFYQQASLLLVPGFLIKQPNQDGFLQGDFEISFFQEVFKPIILAARFFGGSSIGQPSYLYKFRLGGTDLLRGYLENRFRGRHFYLQQNELRFPIWGVLSGAVSLAFGDATDDRFTSTKFAWGGGLRLGLPPDWVKVARIDVGFGKDEWGIFLDFGQSF